MISKLLNWYFSKKALPYWCIFLLDCSIVLCSLLWVYAVNNGASHTLQIFKPLVGTLLIYLVCFVIGFRIFHTYSGIIRYSSFIDLQKVAFAMFSGLALILVCRLALGGNAHFIEIRIKDLVLSSLLAVTLMWGFRILVKYLYDSTYRQEQAKRIFIYGVKEGGVSEPESFSLYLNRICIRCIGCAKPSTDGCSYISER